MNDSTPRAAGGIRPLDIMVALAIAGGIGWALVTRVPRPEPSTFVQSVNLDPLRGIAVQADGRVRSFESHAKTYMGYISGPRRIDGQSNGFTYLDLLFRPDRYENRDVVYVKNQQVRAQIIDAAMDSPTMNTKRAETIFKSGLVSRSLLSEAKVRALLQRLGVL